jgi:hypothetical protein
MTTGTGRSLIIILTCPPSAPIHVHFATVSPERKAVFTPGINFNVGVFRAVVTSAAGFGLSGLLYGKNMTGMAGSAGTFAPVKVYPADARIGPGVGLQFALAARL